MPDIDMPAAAKTLIKELGNWSVETNPGSGTWEFLGYGEYRGDGTRPQIKVREPVDSYLVRGKHIDGREFVAIWMRRPGLVLANTVKAKKVRPLLLALAGWERLDEPGAALVGLVAMLTIWCRKGWTLDTCWRGKHSDEWAPKQLTATDLKTYVAPVLALDVAA